MPEPLQRGGSARRFLIGTTESRNISEVDKNHVKWYTYCADNLDDPIRDRSRIKHPAPSRFLSYPGTHNRADCRAGLVNIRINLGD